MKILRTKKKKVSHFFFNFGCLETKVDSWNVDSFDNVASKFSPADPFAFVPHSLTCCYISYRRHFFSFFSRYSSTCIPLVKDVRYWQGHPGMKLIMIDPNLTRAKRKGRTPTLRLLVASSSSSRRKSRAYDSPLSVYYMVKWQAGPRAKPDAPASSAALGHGQPWNDAWPMKTK